MADVRLGCSEMEQSAEMPRIARDFHCCAAAGTSFQWASALAAAAFVLSAHK